MKSKPTPTLHTATLVDAHGHRHIAIGPLSYCGALGTPEPARAHDVDDLCPRCRDARGRVALDMAMERMGL